VILAAVTPLIFAIFPLQLGQPVWQLNTISSLLGASTNILIGSLLISLARIFNPKDSQLKKNTAFIRKLAGFIAVLMLVLIPLSLFAGSIAIKANEAASKIALKEWKKQLNSTIYLEQNYPRIIRAVLRYLRFNTSSFLSLLGQVATQEPL
jgi:hypothetical protein